MHDSPNHDAIFRTHRFHWCERRVLPNSAPILVALLLGPGCGGGMSTSIDPDFDMETSSTAGSSVGGTSSGSTGPRDADASTTSGTTGFTTGHGSADSSSTGTSDPVATTANSDSSTGTDEGETSGSATGDGTTGSDSSSSSSSGDSSDGSSDTGGGCTAIGCPCTQVSGCDTDLACINSVCEDAPGGNPENLSDGFGGSCAEVPWGQPIGEFCGVTAYSNYNASNDYGYWSGISDFGLNHQCTSFAMRFACTVYGDEIGSACSENQCQWPNNCGNAGTWAANTANNPVLAAMEFIPNGGTTPPQPGDILIITGGYGHVAVIRAVNSDSVVLISQNRTWTTCDAEEVVPMTVNAGVHTVFPGNPNVVGWRRGGPPANCDMPASSGCVANDHPTIQALIDSVSDGATITICGAHQESGIDIDGRSLTIQGANNASIDAQGNDGVFSISDGSVINIQDVEITNGDGGFNGGGALWIHASTVVGQDLELTSNTGRLGGAIRAYGGSTVQLEASLLSGNIADGTEGTSGGGAIHAGDATVALHGTTIVGNQSLHHGAAVYGDGNVDLTLDTCSVTGNTADDVGVVFLSSGSTAQIEGSDIDNNQFGSGGALRLTDSSAEMLNGSIDGNVNNGDGAGAIRLSHGSLHLTGTSVSQNTGVQVGAALVSGEGILTLASCQVEQNEGAIAGLYPGGVELQDSSSLLSEASTFDNSGATVETDAGDFSFNGSFQSFSCTAADGC